MPHDAPGRTARALLINAAGTLLALAEPVGVTYARCAAARDVTVDRAVAELCAALLPWSGEPS